ncbi:hypothetical protein [Rhizobium sp. Root1220]|uniref:hypothetical protein n=1 Tax=Rhizobium sp. Root1220 TaxID=1736432 RepID=UPI001FCD1E2B|nr:hypothetical protein [Rhizobium sp. Root1220]
MSSIWRGHGSAIFLELGQLHPVRRRDGSSGSLTGDYTVMLEWSWRIENRTSILGGSWSDEEGWDTLFKSLMGQTVQDISVFGRLPELSLALSGEKYVVSFMTAEGQPAWSILRRTGSDDQSPSLSVADGKIVADQ